MMSKEIEDLIMARAASMAAFDGEPLEPLRALYIVGAANALQADLLAARDNLLKVPASPEPAPEEVTVLPEPEPAQAEAPEPAPADEPPAPVADEAAKVAPEDEAPAA